MQASAVSRPETITAQPCLRGHLAICRFDHWVKNVFVLPGFVVAFAFTRPPVTAALMVAAVVALFATGLVASSNYVLNEILDAPFDATHPIKRNRPVPSGRVHVPLAYVQWIVLGVAGLALGYAVSTYVCWSLLALWVMGCVYNIPPLRSKDLPYLDVVTEAINNPLRLLIGWYVVAPHAIPPLTLLLSYWMVGCYFMALKRYSELLRLMAAGRAAAYRRSIAYFRPEQLLVTVVFYAAGAMLFFGAFLMRYRMVLVLAFPFIAWVMSTYFSIAFKEDGAAENPEKLYREKKLMVAVVTCTAVLCILFFTDVEAIRKIFVPTVPTEQRQEVGR